MATVEFSSLDWHNRYRLQSTWTRSLRQYLYRQTGISSLRTILDVGCGSGVLEAELAQETQAVVAAVDLDEAILRLATLHAPGARFAQADGHHLPFRIGAFDLVICHFVLLWVADPLQVIREMSRVGRPGAAVAAIAEPDYGGRIDYPTALGALGEWQIQALQAQGADPVLGRRLPSLFIQAGLTNIEAGVLGGQWSAEKPTIDQEAERKMLEYDLAHLNSSQFEFSQLRELKNLDTQAYQRGERVLFVPTFYAWGRVPKAA